MPRPHVRAFGWKRKYEPLPKKARELPIVMHGRVSEVLSKDESNFLDT